MAPEDVEEWLDAWIEDHFASWTSADDAVIRCVNAAQAADITEAELVDAAGGDLAGHLVAEAMAIAESREN